MTKDGNLLGLEIKARRMKLNACVLFVDSKAAGPVRWLPTLVVPRTDRIERIGRECGDAERFPGRPERERDPFAGPPRRPKIPKVDIRLVRP